MDNDLYGHINNAVYYSFFDTAVNSYLIDRGALDLHAGAVIGLVVETHCNFFSPLQYPHTVEAGVRVAASAHSSVRYEIGLFADAAATSAASRALRPRVRRARQPPAGRAARSSCWRRSPRCGRIVHDTHAPDVAAVDAAITTRRSVRAFLDTPVPHRDRARHPARRGACAVGHQHATVARDRAHRHGARGAVASRRRGLRRPRHSARPTRRSTPTTRHNGSAPTSSAAARSAGICTGCSASARPTTSACIVSMRATTSSSTRRSG